MNADNRTSSRIYAQWRALRPVLFSVLGLLFVQLWLFLLSLEELLGRRFEHAALAAAVSGACFLINLFLLTRVRAIDAGKVDGARED